jgi:hypothetical protein
LNQLLDSKQILERRHAELVELRHVLRETATFFEIVSSHSEHALVPYIPPTFLPWLSRL